ncbi:MAG: hypothetical protein NXH83_17790 [Rhodobacteraceae bacterium]|nr:hypothetical protein [Paracoccaceae bacterium]
MTKLITKIKSFSKADAGAALVEYGIILGLIVAVGGTILLNIGSGTKTSLENANTVVQQAASGG